MYADIPIISNMLNICDPNMFPIAMSVSPFLVAAIDVISSGKLVLNATIVRLISFSLIPNILAISTALSTTMSPPIFSPIIPIVIPNIDSHTGDVFLSFVFISISLFSLSNSSPFFAIIMLYIMNPIHSVSSIIPSSFVIVFICSFVPFMHRKNSIIVDIIVIGISNSRVSFLNFSGFIIAHAPNIKNMFAMLLPTTFPMLMSECPSIADVTLTTSSGIDVPIATIVSPITISGM